MRILGLTICGLLLGTCIYLFSALFTASPIAAPGDRLEHLEVSASGVGDESPPSGTLVVASLNIAHGRGTSLNQLLVSSPVTRQNLATLADYFASASADVVALQEADAASHWSGNFNHVAYIAEEALYPWYTQAAHAQIGIANYGTAIMSRHPMLGAVALAFSPTPPTAQKGFTLAEIAWRGALSGDGVVKVDVISVHLDFSRESVRAEQVKELKAVLEGRVNPVIIMGDFNSESIASDLREPDPVSQRYLHSWFDAEQDMTTYKDKRLDWILLSNELEFVRYHTAKEVLSDHRAVVAEIRMVVSGSVEQERVQRAPMDESNSLGSRIESERDLSSPE